MVWNYQHVSPRSDYVARGTFPGFVINRYARTCGKGTLTLVSLFHSLGPSGHRLGIRGTLFKCFPPAFSGPRTCGDKPRQITPWAHVYFSVLSSNQLHIFCAKFDFHINSSIVDKDFRLNPTLPEIRMSVYISVHIEKGVAGVGKFKMCSVLSLLRGASLSLWVGNSRPRCESAVSKLSSL